MSGNKMVRIAVPSVAAILAAGTVAAISSAGNPGDEPVPTSAVVVQALKAGSDPAPEQLAELKTSAVAEYSPRLSEAKQVAAPPGSPAGETWVVAPAADGGACLTISNAGSTCGSAADISQGHLMLWRIDAPKLTSAQIAADKKADAAGLTIPFSTRTLPGQTTAFGIAPKNATQVAAQNAAGVQESQAPISNGIFRLDLGTVKPEDASNATSSYVFHDAVGNTVAAP